MDPAQHGYAFSKLQAAIEAIPDHEKSDYLEALRVAPYLVKTESQPLKFLRCSNWNASAAAQALVTYWRRRREIFGADKAFLPMVITGEGALSTKVIEFIKTGFVVHIPDGTQSCNIYVDHSRRLVGYSADVRIQSVFYLAQLISEHEVANTSGFNFLIPVSVPEKLDVAGLENTTLVLNTLPIKTKAWHLFNCLPESEDPGRFQTFRKYFKGIAANLLRNFPAYFHDTTDKDQIVQIMQSYGISKNGLPRFLGGNWSYERYADWLVQRGQTDQDMFLKAQQEANSHATAVAAACQVSVNGGGQNTVMGSATTLLNMRRSLTTADQLSAHQDQQQATRKVKKIHATNQTETDSSLNSLSEKFSSGTQAAAVFVQDWYREIAKAMNELPADETAAYREALLKATADIWKEESNVNRFLMVEDFNPYFTAKRLARYWRLRKESFGPQRFLPLHQTGEEALGRRELQMLATSFLNLLPSDEKGCPIIFSDCSRLPVRNSMPDESRDRCFFYLFSLLSENDKAQQEGAVMLYQMESTPYSRVSLKALEEMAQAFPLSFKAVHLLSLGGKISPEDKARMRIGKETYLHESKSVNKISSNLENFGIPKSSIPMSLGGEWGYEKFLQWQELRMRMEFKIPLGFSGRNKSEAYSFPGIRPHTLLPSSEKAERNRRLNIIHCKRKRDRERLSTEMMREQGVELRRNQDALQAENARLMELTKKATALVEELERNGYDKAGSDAAGFKLLSTTTFDGQSIAPAGNETDVSSTTSTRHSDAPDNVVGGSVMNDSSSSRSSRDQSVASIEGRKKYKAARSAGFSRPLKKRHLVVPASAVPPAKKQETVPKDQEQQRIENHMLLNNLLPAGLPTRPGTLPRQSVADNALLGSRVRPAQDLGLEALLLQTNSLRYTGTNLPRRFDGASLSAPTPAVTSWLAQSGLEQPRNAALENAMLHSLQRQARRDVQLSNILSLLNNAAPAPAVPESLYNTANQLPLGSVLNPTPSCLYRGSQLPPGSFGTNQSTYQGFR